MEFSESRKPTLTWLLIILNVAIFEITLSMPEALRNSVLSLLSFSAGTSFEVWRWFSNLFLHASVSHIFFNMLGLYFFGKIVEEEVGRKWYLAIYFAAGLLGNFAFMFTSTAPAIGASAAIFGLMGAAMLLKPLRKTHMYVFPLPLGIVAILFALFESLIVSSGVIGPVANIAHVAGMVVGIIFAFFYSPKKTLKGFLLLLVCILLILVLVPFILIITFAGGIILQVIEYIIGFFLYGVAKLLSVIWV
jgi:membrane associated rhomboid family serine protease